MRIAIVGAGAAGLAAAQRLTGTSLEVEVLEARERPGGRIWTHRDWGFLLELGAAYLHGTSPNPLHQEGLPMADHQDRQYFDGSGRWIRHSHRMLEAGRKQLERALELAWEEPHDLPLSQALQLAGQRPGRGRQPGNIPVADTDQLSARGDPQADPVTGPDFFYSYPVESWAEGLNIRYNRAVQRVQWSQSGVVLDGEAYDRAILTVPLPVLSSLEFEPPLPARPLPGWTVLNKLAIAFEEPFWQSEATSLAPMNRPEGCFSYFLNGWKLWQKPVLVGFLSGRQGWAWEQRSDREIVEEAQAALSPLGYSPLRGYVLTRWGQDPWTRGGYSILGPGQGGEVFDFPALGALRFAGEATWRPAPATVHGAWASGLREAEQILQGM